MIENNNGIINRLENIASKEVETVSYTAALKPSHPAKAEKSPTFDGWAFQFVQIALSYSTVTDFARLRG
jgi:hypothetical protein